MRPGEQTPGVVPRKEGGTSVVLWAPFAATAALVLHDTGATLPMQRAEYGYWTLYTAALRTGDRYLFSLDGQAPIPDPASRYQPEGVHGPSQVWDPAGFAWTDAAWLPPPLEEWIFYELHTGTFTPEGSFAGIEQKLDHLKELGVNAIELMPVAQFPGNRNWGYDGVYPYAVQQSYGGPAGLQQLVDACHRKGLSVVLDVVYNHLGPEGNYLEAYGPYFTGKYCTPWGKAVNYDDAWCDGVRDFVTGNALMWFRDFHIDALRLDAVHAIRDFSPEHILLSLRKHTDELVAATGRQHYLIIECDLNDHRFIRPPSAGGYGMDAQWNDEFHHALRVSAGQERHGYYADFNGVADLSRAYEHAYVYDGRYSPQRHRMFGTSAAQHPGRQFVVFSQNHDQTGNRMLGERSSTLLSFEMQKLLAAAVLLSPYLPLLFMGEEWSEPHPFLYFTNHGDPELAQAVREGRSHEFAAFRAQGTPPDPQAADTFEQSQLQWSLTQQEPHATMLRYYKALIRLRKSHTALSHPDRQTVSTLPDAACNTLVLCRGPFCCLMNFSEETQQMQLPGGKGSGVKVLDSADPQWRGPEAGPSVVLPGESLPVLPHSILVYAYENMESAVDLPVATS